MLFNVKNHEHLVKNLQTNVITNTNMSEIEQYRTKKQKEEEVKNNVTNLENQIYDLKQKIDHILYMLENRASE